MPLLIVTGAKCLKVIPMSYSDKNFRCLKSCILNMIIVWIIISLMNVPYLKSLYIANINKINV